MALAFSSAVGTVFTGIFDGVDTRTPVDDKDYQVPFRFNGKIDKLTFNLGREQLSAEDREVMKKALAKLK